MSEQVQDSIITVEPEPSYDDNTPTEDDEMLDELEQIFTDLVESLFDEYVVCFIVTNTLFSLLVLTNNTSNQECMEMSALTALTLFPCN